jgi:mannose-1-phosphate guanylyltransferase
VAAGVWSSTSLDGVDPEPPVLIGAGVEVGEGARIAGPAVIGEGCSIGAGAFVGRGAVLLEGARVGAGEMLAGGIAGPIETSR